MNHNGLYLFIPAKDQKKACFLRYNGGSSSSSWLEFCYDHVAPSSRLIDIVSVGNVNVPLAFKNVDIVVDDEGLFQADYSVNAFASFLYGQPIVGDALLGFVAYDPIGEGDHVFPLSEHPHFSAVINFIRTLLDIDIRLPDAKED